MHVDYPIVGSTQNVKLVAIRQDVYVYQGTQETLALHVPYVSTRKIFVLFYIFFFHIARYICMISYSSRKTS